MAEAALQDLILDSSVLINFLAVDLLGTLARQPEYRLTITDHVYDEISAHYLSQQARLKAGLTAGHLVQTSVKSEPELEIFKRLVRLGSLGTGECGAIAAAKSPLLYQRRDMHNANIIVCPFKSRCFLAPYLFRLT